MFILSCVGGAVCGAFVMLTNTKMYSFALGVFAILGLLDPEAPHVVTAVLCAVIPFVFSFALAFVLYKESPVAETVSTNQDTAPCRPEGPLGNQFSDSRQGDASVQCAG